MPHFARPTPVLATLLSASAAILLSGTALVAQGASAEAALKAKAKAKANANPSRQLGESLKAMSSLPSYRVIRRKESPKNQGGNAGNVFIIMNGGMNGGEVEVDTVWTQDALFATAFDGKEFLVQRGRRMIARSGQEGEWQHRSGRFARGRKTTGPVDPELLFSVLKQLDLQVTHKEVGMHEGRPAAKFTVALDQEQAAELLWSGALPHSGNVLGAGIAQMIIGGGAGGGASTNVPPPSGTFDLRITADPATRLIHEVRVRVIEENPMANMGGGNGAFVFQAGIGGNRNGAAVMVDVTEEEEEEEEDGENEVDEDEVVEGAQVGVGRQAPAKPGQEKLFKDGLPIRDMKDKVATTYVWEFTELGAAQPFALDREAKQMLGM